MTLISAYKAMKLFDVVDYRTFESVAEQYQLKKHPVGKRIKYNQDEIKRKLNEGIKPHKKRGQIF